MQITRERKIYAAVLGLAVIALGLNQFVFSPPQSQAQSAESLLAQGGPHARAEVKSEVASPASAVVPELAALEHRMDDIARRDGLDGQKVADVFHPPAGWVKPAPAHQADSVAAFAAQHHLVAVLKSSRGGMAVVAGAIRKSLRIGQQLDGFKLVAVGERSATFAAAQGNVELTLPTDQPSDAQIVTSGGR